MLSKGFVHCDAYSTYMLSALLNWLSWYMGKEGVECTMPKEYLRTYCPNIHTVVLGRIRETKNNSGWHSLFYKKCFI